VSIITPHKLKFHSRAYEKRIGLGPMRIAIALAWVIVVGTFLVAIVAVKSSQLWGSLALLSVFSFGAYMLFLSNVWLKGSNEQYELSIDDDHLDLSTYNEQNQTSTIQQIELSEVTTAEYYQPRDTCNLLLNSEKCSLEIPLWSFGPIAERKIVDYVRSKGVQVTGIPNDIEV